MRRQPERNFTREPTPRELLLRSVAHGICAEVYNFKQPTKHCDCEARGRGQVCEAMRKAAEAAITRIMGSGEQD